MADSPRTLTAFFDRREDAQGAVDRLQRLGLPEDSIRLTGGEEYSGRTDYAEDRGFWASLSDLFFPGEDRAAYAEGLRRGGYLLTVTMITAGKYDDVLDILDDEGAVDVDQRAETWRAEGWTGSGAAGFTGTSAGMTGATAGEMAGTTAGTRSDMAARSAVVDEEVVPVVEEELRIGKRDVNLGRVRVRSYVVEEPVSEQLNLRGERVEVERRPVDRPVGATDAAFTERRSKPKSMSRSRSSRRTRASRKKSPFAGRPRSARSRFPAPSATPRSKWKTSGTAVRSEAPATRRSDSSSSVSIAV